jgi:hypothetical protein
MGFGLMTEFIVLFDTSRDYTLHFTITHTHTSVHSHVFTAVAWQRLQRQIFPFLWVSELSPASVINFLRQQLNTSDYLTH